jgi:carboxyl-terminal processing protease
VREVIAIASVRSRMLEPGYAYIRLAQFRVNTGDELEAELLELYEEHGDLKGIVLDLRNNPGGVLQASAKVVDAFVEQGRIVYTKGRLEGNDLEFSANLATVAPDVPLVVLINNGSASASEIVAGALQDHGRAVVMGTQSFGKGSVQTLLPLDGSRAIKLTTSLYYTPSGRSIQAQGITPDIIVDDAFVTRRSRSISQYTEADLPGRLDNGNGEEVVESDEEMAEALISAEEVLVTDYPLNEALNVLKGVNAFKPGNRVNTNGSFAQRDDL